MRAELRERAGAPAWLWLLPILLLATALSIPHMDADAFHHDEAYSMLAAGVLRPGPHSLAAVREATALRSPEQALGWPILLSVWGRFAGWSEFAARTIPLFAGILTLALVYRTGSNLFAAPAGLGAALLLTGSAFFLAYFTIARTFTLVSFFATLCLWCYWHVALQPRAPGRGAPAGLLAGSIGLLYSHYFGALLLPALGLFHLLFMPRERGWWRPVILIGLAVPVAVWQLPVLLRGLDRTLANEALHSQAMSMTEVLERLLRFLSNDLLDPAAPAGALLAILLPAALMLLALQRLRSGKGADALWLTLFVAATLLLLVLVLNEALRVMHTSRIRYLIALWPLVTLTAGAGLWHLARRHGRLAVLLPALWLLLGARLSLGGEFRYEVDYLLRSDFHHIARIMRERLPEADFLILDYEAERLDPGRLYTRSLGLPYKIIYRDRENPLASVGQAHLPYPYAWMLFRSQDSAEIAAQAAGLGRVFCERLVDAWGYTLERHALSTAHCPDSPARLAFAAGIQLSGPDLRLEGGVLRLHAGLRSADEGLLANYSLAVHIIDPRAGRRVAQGDVGVGPGSFVPVTSEIDVSALPAGEYELRVALYDWQTGARLHGRDLETGVSGDMHSLQHFRIG